MERATDILAEWWEVVQTDLPIHPYAQALSQHRLDGFVEHKQLVASRFFNESDIIPRCPSLVVRSLMNAALKGINYANQKFGEDTLDHSDTISVKDRMNELGGSRKRRKRSLGTGFMGPHLKMTWTGVGFTPTVFS